MAKNIQSNNKKLSIKGITCFLFIYLLSAQSVATTQWKWSDLIPDNTQQASNPFANFTSIQRYDLLIISNLQRSPHNEKLQKESQISLQRFKDAGIDILPLIKKQQKTAKARQTAAKMVNKARLGEQGKLAGYLVPLQLSGEKITQFLLVPTAGACIHSPPPPANQIILVDFPSGFEMVGLYTPIWVEGTLHAESNLPNVQLSDGELAVNTAYMMQAKKVRLYN
ncbi:hypothetical protein CW745_03255 [Psychromonas sp. psych-6C06]|uniref:DUF3299 domain-containing protein n=1 Tax=Psychromonas sp. psych-6C06 TaxID=2058089 RepID=UPI000C34AA53|nr:DUF3299 domain-containing protein [Psychromonas sp. psych-6C06]PKF62463.1 hypothetical protein CW745_03255 [Psychromonas sp. psych-6C06]